jgi:hypothetical protein
MSTRADDRLPFTCLVPDAAGVIDIFDQTAALHMAVADRAGIASLDAIWDSPGNYILLDPITTEGTWGCYVGKAPAGIKSRLYEHVRTKDHWNRALLIRRDTTYGFQSGHAAWLEGRLYDLLTASANGRPNNRNRPSDDTLPPYDQLMLETTVDPISRVLRLIGYDPAPQGEEGLPAAKRAHTFYGTGMQDLISAGLIEAGARLVSTMPMYPADATLNADGTITWDRGNYPSPSAAGAAVKGGKATNGWSFWAIETDTGKVPLSTLRSRLPERPEHL